MLVEIRSNTASNAKSRASLDTIVQAAGTECFT